MTSLRKAGRSVKLLDVKAAARAELTLIYDYSVAEFGTKVAENYMLGLRGAFDRLLEFPFIGPVYPDVTPEVRIFLHRSHRIFYRIDGEIVLIVRVLHKRRDVRGEFGRWAGLRGWDGISSTTVYV